jgi:hypothetical protein
MKFHRIESTFSRGSKERRKRMTGAIYRGPWRAKGARVWLDLIDGWEISVHEEETGERKGMMGGAGMSAGRGRSNGWGPGVSGGKKRPAYLFRKMRYSAVGWIGDWAGLVPSAFLSFLYSFSFFFYEF